MAQKKMSIREKNAKKNQNKGTKFSKETPEERLARLQKMTNILQCQKCHHSWIARVPDPQRCPNCKQDWRTPYVNKRK